jgi:hypothetical protein
MILVTYKFDAHPCHLPLCWAHEKSSLCSMDRHRAFAFGLLENLANNTPLKEDEL